MLLSSVSRHLGNGRDLLSHGAVEVDLSAVGEVDSAALALLFDWTRRARAKGVALTFTGLPPGLIKLAEVYGVAELLTAQG